MTTITKERIELFIKNPLENGLTRGEQMELARIAMASLDAEPVRYLNKFSGVCVTLEQQPNAADDVAVYIPLYAAPPAPVVPEECPAELPYAQVKAVADLFALCWQSGEVVTYTPDPEKATIWLNNYSGTCVQEYVKLERLQEALAGNSPVTQDGWISCSERMPDREYVLAGDFSGTHYLASIPNVQVGIYADWFDDEKPCWDDGDGNDLHLKQVTHWMPLPEPPKQE
ncbi:DUF551 domain-containing protein [Salmonella enterica]|nr:DUF551 domain-containing protein [Salmonella enterica]HAK1999354.1 DUF551 domain-containing protein [Salmonella enterica]